MNPFAAALSAAGLAPASDLDRILAAAVAFFAARGLRVRAVSFRYGHLLLEADAADAAFARLDLDRCVADLGPPVRSADVRVVRR